MRKSIQPVQIERDGIEGWMAIRLLLTCINLVARYRCLQGQQTSFPQYLLLLVVEVHAWVGPLPLHVSVVFVQAKRNSCHNYRGLEQPPLKETF